MLSSFINFGTTPAGMREFRLPLPVRSLEWNVIWWFGALVMGWVIMGWVIMAWVPRNKVLATW